jgi:hypothetical protein
MYAMRALVVLPLLAGCDQLFGLSELSIAPDADPSTFDANVGAVIDAAPCTLGTTRFGGNGAGGRGLFTICLSPSAGTLDLSGQIDTDTCAFVVAQDTIGTDVCVVNAGTIRVLAPVDAKGSRPLVLVASSIEIGSTLDAGSHTGQGAGAGANWSGCGVTAKGANAALGGGGGAGGSFGTRGGNGGLGSSGARAYAKDAAPPDRIRGGCAGGDGGAADSGGRSIGGHGGGAVYLIAQSTIRVNANGAISAVGAGGRGGALDPQRGGGGGGAGAGAGGLIGLDAPAITFDLGARLNANGGGGGGGGSIAVGQIGQESSLPGVRAQGGAGGGGGLGGAGGDGSVREGNGIVGDAGKSGGGGGGGGGSIRLYTTSAPVMTDDVSPPWVIE